MQEFHKFFEKTMPNILTFLYFCSVFLSRGHKDILVKRSVMLDLRKEM